MANTLQFDQISSVLNQINKIATGQIQPAAVNTKDFVAQAQTTLLSGYDNVMGAISQVLSRTIFSIRPYDRKFNGLAADAVRWGNHVRKISYIDGEFENDDMYPLDDGESIDQYVINKPKVVQTNFYGGQRFQRHYTVFRDQLNHAFQGPDELARFLAGVTQNVTDQRNQAWESLARNTLVNMMGAKIQGDSNNVIHLVTEYNEFAGLTLTPETVRQPANFPGFVKWMFGRLKTLSQMLTERSVKYHINIQNKFIPRHTPIRNQRIYLYTPEINMIDSQVLADVYNDQYLRLANHESVNFWQSIETPDTINVIPNYINAQGVVVNSETTTTKANVLGVIFDEEAIGLNEIFDSMDNTPYNARGKYYNVYYHWNLRWWNDMTENCLVLLMD